MPVGGPGDLRAWDAVLSGPAVIGIDAETRLYDIQALQRRTELKKRDGHVDRVVLVVADTRHNRTVLRLHGHDLAATFPIRGDDALAALRSGKDPGGDAIVLL